MKLALLYIISVALSLYSVFGTLYVVEFSIVSILLSGFCVLYDLFKRGVGAVFVFGLLVAGFLYPRAIVILTGLLHPFDGFSIDFSDNKWVFLLVFFVAVTRLFIEIGYVLHVYIGNELIDSSEYDLPMYGSKIGFWMVFIGFLFTLAYILSLGGFGELVNNYTAEFYQDLGDKGGLSPMLKNIAIYFMISGLCLYGSTVKLDSVEAQVKWMLMIALGAICSITYIKREYLFEIVFIALVGIHFRGAMRSRYLRLVGAFVLFGIMIGMFFARSNSVDLDKVKTHIDFLDTPEYWILDQFIFVSQSGNDLMQSDYGVRFLQMFAAPFMGYFEYVPVDKILIENELGIKDWGVPGTIFSYLIISFGLFFSVLAMMIISIAIGYVDSILIKRSYSKWIYSACVPVWMMFLWFIFRNGDPVSAVFATNRILLFTILSAVFVNFIGGKIKNA